MRKGWKLITEAECVDAFEVSRPCETVVLFLHILVQHLPVRGRQLHVHIVVASHDNLDKQMQDWEIVTCLTLIILVSSV